MKLRKDRPHVLYRFWNAEGALMYVGITADPGSRWKDHGKEKLWWTEVVNVTVEHFPDRDSVLAAEIAAIKAEKPVHNVTHNEGVESDLVHQVKMKLVSATKSYRYNDAICKEAGKAAMDKAIALLRAGVGPTEVANLSPFTDAYIRKYAREAGIPPARPARGASKPKADAE